MGGGCKGDLRGTFFHSRVSIWNELPEAGVEKGLVTIFEATELKIAMQLYGIEMFYSFPISPNS